MRMNAAAVEENKGVGPLAGALLNYWTGKCGSRRMPGRRDIDPIEMRKLLPNILLVDIEADTGRLKFRLVGTRITEMYGGDYTGQYLDETWFGRLREQIVEAYIAVARSGDPNHSLVRFTNCDGLEFDMERVILPLSSDGVHVDKLIALLDIPQHSTG